VDQAGKLVTLKAVSLGAAIVENVWYRVGMAVSVDAGLVSVVGTVVKHEVPADPEATAGLDGLRGLCLSLHYALPDAGTGINPNWPGIGYPGPQALPKPAADVERPITPVVPIEDLTLSADAVVHGRWTGAKRVTRSSEGSGALRKRFQIPSWRSIRMPMASSMAANSRNWIPMPANECA